MIYHTWSTHEILIITLKWSWSLIPMIPCGVIKHALLGIYYFIRWFSHDFGRWNLHFAWDFQASHLWWPPCSQMMFPSTSHCKHRIGHLKSLTFTNLMMISYYFIDIPFICPISHYEGRQIPAPAASATFTSAASTCSTCCSASFTKTWRRGGIILVLDFATTVGLKIDGRKPLNISKSISEAYFLSSFSLWKLLFYGYTPIFRQTQSWDIGSMGSLTQKSANYSMF